jgi:hypothetical protein
MDIAHLPLLHPNDRFSRFEEERSGRGGDRFFFRCAKDWALGGGWAIAQSLDLRPSLARSQSPTLIESLASIE